MGLLMTSKNKSLRAFAASGFLVVIALLAAGCAKEPTPVGAKLLPGSDLVRLDTAEFRSTRCFSQSNITQTETSPRVLVGTFENLQSWGLYRFTALPDSIRTMRFVSAQLNLRTIYHYGDSLAPFSFTVHKILMNWLTDSLTIDSLRAAGFYNNTPCGSYSASSLGDTVSISVPLDTSAVRALGTLSDTTRSDFGFLLKPTNSRVIKGFGSFLISDASMIPQLLLRMKDVAGNIDTLKVTLGTHRFVTTGPNPFWATDSSRLYVMNGTSSRGYVEFDVSRIPAHAAVHKAILELSPDQQLMRTNSFTVDSLLAYLTGDDGTTLTYITGAGGPVQVGSSRRYQILIGPFVQRWLRGAKLSRVAIAGLMESASIDQFVFHGTSGNAALKPKLTVIYSLLQ